MDCSRKNEEYEKLKSQLRILLRELHLRNKLLDRYQNKLKTKKTSKLSSSVSKGKSMKSEELPKGDPKNLTLHCDCQVLGDSKPERSYFKSQDHSEFEISSTVFQDSSVTKTKGNVYHMYEGQCCSNLKGEGLMMNVELLHKFGERHSLLWKSILDLQEKLNQMEVDTINECEPSAQINEKLLYLKWKCENLKAQIASKYQEILSLHSHHSGLNVSNTADPQYELKVYAELINIMRDLCLQYKENIKLHLLNLSNIEI